MNTMPHQRAWSMHVNDPQGFAFFDGPKAYSLSEFLEFINDARYHHHVTDQRNDFYNWIKDVFFDEELACKVRSARDASEVYAVLNVSRKNQHHHSLVSVRTSPVCRQAAPPVELEGSSRSALSDLTPSVTHLQRRPLPIEHDKSLTPLSYNEVIRTWKSSESPIVMYADKETTHNLVHESVEKERKEEAKQITTSPNPNKPIVYWAVWDFLLGIIIGFAACYVIVQLLLGS